MNSTSQNLMERDKVLDTNLIHTAFTELIGRKILGNKAWPDFYSLYDVEFQEAGVAARGCENSQFSKPQRHFKANGRGTTILYTVLLTVCPREEVCRAALAAGREWGQKRAHTEIWRLGTSGGALALAAGSMPHQCSVLSPKKSSVTLFRSHLILLCFYLFISS